jgi:hypothetical protein
MQYRIKQTAENIFIAQCKECFLFKWESIDNIINLVWTTSRKYHHNETFEAALEVIENHKKHLESKHKYPKYYKVPYNPNTDAN